MTATLTQVRAYDQAKTDQWDVPAGTVAGHAVISPAGDRPGVAITSPGGTTTVKSGLKGDVSSMTIASAGFNNATGKATIAVDGQWSGPVTGASDTTPMGTLVYAVVNTGVVTSLTLTSSGNKKFGVVASPLGRASSSRTVVEIGVFA